MRIHRFYIKKFKGIANHEAKISVDGHDAAENEQNEALIHQWRDIFRMKTGDELAIFNEEVGEWKGEFLSLDKKKGVEIRLLEQISSADASMPKREIYLYMALIKNSNFDLVVEKATELGVSHIIPITTERTVKANLNFYRLNRLAIEATEQSGRISPPEIHDIIDLKDAIVHAKKQGLTLFFGHIGEKNEIEPSKKEVALFIGPEGGWTEAEIALFASEGIQPISLGEFVLRAETAAIVGVSKLVA
jgi:16S rRNA (uracil1498-N3)-methyltransferase